MARLSKIRYLLQWVVCTGALIGCSAAGDGERRSGDDQLKEYQPCAGKSCGDSCSRCAPNHPDCLETGEVKYCQPDGSCRGLLPVCERLDRCPAMLCPAGTRCENSRCVPEPSAVFCGGIAGIPCPGSGKCVDDESDECDPTAGGADCGGICVCARTATCGPNARFDSSPGVCECVPERPTGGTCGTRTCGSDEYCCNESCSTCAPIGGACTQEVCQPAR